MVSNAEEPRTLEAFAKEYRTFVVNAAKKANSCQLKHQKKKNLKNQSKDK